MKLHASIEPVVPLELDPGSALVPDVVGTPEVSPVSVEALLELVELLELVALVELVEPPPDELVELIEPVELEPPLDDSAPGFVGWPQAVTLHHAPMNTTRTARCIPPSPR